MLFSLLQNLPWCLIQLLRNWYFSSEISVCFQLVRTYAIPSILSNTVLGQSSLTKRETTLFDFTNKHRFIGLFSIHLHLLLQEMKTRLLVTYCIYLWTCSIQSQFNLHFLGSSHLISEKVILFFSNNCLLSTYQNFGLSLIEANTVLGQSSLSKKESIFFNLTNKHVLFSIYWH